jgi:hypothetical protein
MENQAAGRFMGIRECDWVRARLPLFAGDGVHASAPGDGGDLAADEALVIERHLSDCSSCREHRAAIGRALAVLVAAAEQMPFEHEAPSLWPVLERRIAMRDARRTSRWRQTARRLAERLAPKTMLDRARPLRLAWTRDSLLEALRRGRTSLGSNRDTGLVLRYGIAVALAVVFVGASALRRQWVDAQSTMASNAAPLADRDPPSRPIDEPTMVSAPEDPAEPPTRQVAEADPVRGSESPGFVIDGAPVVKQTPQSRFGYEFERETRMAPDVREPKPVY